MPALVHLEFRQPPSPYGGEVEVPGDIETKECQNSSCAWPNPMAGGKERVPKCAAKPDAGKAAVCQLRL